MTRHPWTNADDYVRCLGPVGRTGVILSRHDASLIIAGVAKALGMEVEVLAIKLSDAEQAKTQADHDLHANRLIQALGYRA